MIFSFIFGALFLILLALSIVFIIKSRKKVIKIFSTIAATTSFFLFIFIPFSFHTVDSGEVAVVKHLGKATAVRTAGTYFDFWLTEKYSIYDAKVQNLDITTQTFSKDAQTMDIQMTVQYQVDTSNMINIANTYGSLEILNNRIESVANDAMKSVMAESTADEIIQNRAQVSMDVTETIMARIDSSYYVNVKTAVLTDIGFSDAYEEAVEKQMIAEREKEAAIIKAEQELEVAKREAEAALERAQGEANAQKALAEAEAYSASIKIVELARTLGYNVVETTDENGNVTFDITWNDVSEQKVILEYLQYLEYLAKWDGKLPSVVSDGSGIMITIPTQETE